MMIEVNRSPAWRGDCLVELGNRMSAWLRSQPHCMHLQLANLFFYSGKSDADLDLPTVKSTDASNAFKARNLDLCLARCLTGYTGRLPVLVSPSRLLPFRLQ